MLTRVQVGGVTVEAGGLPTEDVTNIEIVQGNTRMFLKWTDPEDTVLPDGKIVAKWAGTKLVYKEGSYPINQFDGIQALDNKVRNQYKEEWFEVTNLKNDVVYYFSLFPYTNTGLINNSETQRIEGKAYEPKIYGLEIDETNENPEKAVTYIEKSIGMGVGYNAWKNTSLIKNIKPCVLDYSGAFKFYLNPNDFTMKENGEPAVLEEQDNCMIEIMRFGYNIDKVGSKIKITVTEEKNNPTFCYQPFNKDDGTPCEKLYISIYPVYPKRYKQITYPQRGVIPSERDISDTTVRDIFEKCISKQYGFFPLHISTLTAIQLLYLLMYKNLDSITNTGETSLDIYNNSRIKTGWADKKGMNVKNFNIENVNLSKFLGLEEFMTTCCVNGLSTNGDIIFYDKKKYGIGSEERLYTIDMYPYGYVKSMNASNEHGLIVEKTTQQGSLTTHYCTKLNTTFGSRVMRLGASRDFNIFGANFSISLEAKGACTRKCCLKEGVIL